jgi:pimeloyl-ACP methyl ester carboxylesterase
MLHEFRIEATEADLADLAQRLAHGRTVSPAIVDGGESPATIARIDELLANWRDGYDWTGAQARLNQIPQYRAEVDGVGLHLVLVPGVGPQPLPLLLTNGWPSSFVEYEDVIEALTDPAAHGGAATDAFTVVIPALPGYGFSDRCLDRPLDRPRIAEWFNRLMVEELGFDRYVAHGDDIGGGVVSQLGRHDAGHVMAIQTANWMAPYTGAGTPPLTAAEQAYRAAEQAWRDTEGAYSHIQATRPQTLAYGLTDSPIGLGAWILEKFLTWSDPATRERLSADHLLTNVMIYWLTATIGSSVRLYATDRARPGPADVVTVPTSVVVPHEPKLAVPPQSWLRRAYPQLTRVVTVERGGHFLAAEAPNDFVELIRSAFRPYR